MKETICMLAFCLLFAMPLASAIETVYEIGLTVESNYSVSLAWLEITQWHVTQSNERQQNISLLLNFAVISNSNKTLYTTILKPNFLLLSNPPVVLNETLAVVDFPYLEDGKYVQVYHDNTLILQFDIQESLCDENGMCEGFENHRSCPSDCREFDKDGYCASLSYDGGCDPDCHPSLDIDCTCPNHKCDEYENHEICPDDCPSGGDDDYCDGLEDDKCDPDCIGPQDPGCRIETAGISGEIDWLWILILIAIVTVIAAFLLYKRGSETEIGNNLRPSHYNY